MQYFVGSFWFGRTVGQGRKKKRLKSFISAKMEILCRGKKNHFLPTGSTKQQFNLSDCDF